MDKKALYKLSYGVFMLSTKVGSKVNGCITNTCMQVAGSPTRIAICVINTNYTCDLIKESGVFALTLLDQTTGFELIQHFGFQSGRDVDKFANLRLPEDVNGIPYLAWQACAVISGKVVNSLDLGTHTMFIAEVVDAKVLSGPQRGGSAHLRGLSGPRKAEEEGDKGTETDQRFPVQDLRLRL